MAEKIKSVEELKADIEFWRKAFEESDTEKRKFANVLEEQSNDLVATREAGKRAIEISSQLLTERNEALKHLKILAAHVSGRTGMLGRSDRFCSCNNQYGCPLGAANDFLKGIKPPESQEAA